MAATSTTAQKGIAGFIGLLIFGALLGVLIWYLAKKNAASTASSTPSTSPVSSPPKVETTSIAPIPAATTPKIQEEEKIVKKQETEEIKTPTFIGTAATSTSPYFASALLKNGNDFPTYCLNSMMQTVQCNGDYLNQRWTWNEKDNTIKNGNTLCLDVKWGDSIASSQVQQNMCSPAFPEQKWTYDFKTRHLIPSPPSDSPIKSELCLDVTNGVAVEGKWATLAECNIQSTQSWFAMAS